MPLYLPVLFKRQATLFVLIIRRAIVTTEVSEVKETRQDGVKSPRSVSNGARLGDNLKLTFQGTCVLVGSVSGCLYLFTLSHHDRSKEESSSEDHPVLIIIAAWGLADEAAS